MALVKETCPQIACYNLQGNVRLFTFTSAKERDPERSYIHYVDWKDVAAYAKEFLSEKELKQVQEDDDLSWTIDPPLTKLIAVLNKVFHERKNQQSGVEFKRGDVLRLNFMAYRDWGVTFFDGKEIIPARDDNGDYHGVPSCMAVPEFAPSYWDDVHLLAGNGIIHVTDLPASLDLKDVDGIDDLKVMKLTLSGKEFFLFSSEESNVEEFIEHGFCHSSAFLDGLDKALEKVHGATKDNILYIP
jgi:hypothetical protein